MFYQNEDEKVIPPPAWMVVRSSWSIRNGFKGAVASTRTIQLRRFMFFMSASIFLLFTALFSFWNNGGIVNMIPRIRYNVVHPKNPILDVTNSTLGFERILALSTGTPWRVEGLLSAAELTGLDIDIPPQPYTPPEMVEAFQNMGPKEARHPSRGSAKAWIAHLDLIRHIIQRGYSTALIMEDDADWDVELRSRSILPLAQGVRVFTKAVAGGMRTPYGGNWDVLWMGHCGEYSHEDMPYYAWPDETVVPQDEYTGWARVDLRRRIPEGMRTTHPTTNSVCTFAYAVTGHGAQKILQTIGAGPGEAYDVELSKACKSKKLDCVTIHPEIFRQYVPPRGMYGETSLIKADNKNEMAWQGDRGHMGATANIKKSARCAALFDTTCQYRDQDHKYPDNTS